MWLMQIGSRNKFKSMGRGIDWHTRQGRCAVGVRYQRRLLDLARHLTRPLPDPYPPPTRAHTRPILLIHIARPSIRTMAITSPHPLLDPYPSPPVDPLGITQARVHRGQNKRYTAMYLHNCGGPRHCGSQSRY